jgi:UDP-galactose transporter B1
MGIDSPFSLTDSRTITLTRKLFTMLLSVFLYNHKLTPGQWGGAGVVFAGISVEAWVKRQGKNRPTNLLSRLTRIPLDIHAKRVIKEEEKAKLKSL